jgi:hypothetical protein
MFPIVLIAALLAAPQAQSAAPAQSAERAEPAFVSIFNGKDLTGWTGPATIWSVKDGVLVGKNTPTRQGGSITSAKSYRNFILEFDVKYLPPADSGVMMRQPSLQMQIGTSHSQHTELTGSFYLGALAYTETSTAKDTWKYFFPGRWNTIRLDVRGAIFTVSVNGNRVHRYADAGHPDAAPISFQVHNDEDSMIEFKNIKIAELR